MKGRIYTVSQINSYVRRLFERDAFLSDVFVQGEISNFKLHGSGHIYFTLKDKNAQISCVMFSSYGAGLKFLPENGMKVTVFGGLSLYEKTGQYQLYVRIMEPDGTGALYLAFEQLKEKLRKKGYFEESYKKPIPEYPETIAVLTSPTGAAVRDIISIAGRRDPSVEIVVVPVLVQGELAAESIAKAIEDVNQWKGCDLIILGRGGGSIEDLWAFNEEKVARAIYSSKIPIISAVGHETDYTIADFTADLRAATPSAAAEIAIKPRMSSIDRVKSCHTALDRIMTDKLSVLRDRLCVSVDYFASDSMLNMIFDREMYISGLSDRLVSGMENRTERLAARLEKARALLDSLSPLKVLERGYALVTDKSGEPVSSAKGLDRGESILIRFKDSAAMAVVGEIYGEKDI